LGSQNFKVIEMPKQPECTTSVDGSKKWYLDGGLHREDGPAYKGSNGVEQWWLNGKLHREDGPAIELGDGFKQWWFDGMKHSPRDYWTRTLKDKSVGTLIARSWGSCLKLSQTSFLLCDFAQKSLTLLDGA
jgi:hypothetical protein